MTVLEYLMENYVSKYPEDKKPSDYQVMLAVDAYKDQMIVVKDDDIKCVAIYLKLTEETLNILTKEMLEDVESLRCMFQERGSHYHFILLAAQGAKVILKGIEEVKKRGADSISWFNPQMTKLHKYKFRR